MKISDSPGDGFNLPVGVVPPTADFLRWDGGTVPRLARRIYDERRWGDMPLLGDALLDAGCDDEALMQHCRSEGPHVRGCWAIDAILGKS
jgi:hypothetical protein